MCSRDLQKLNPFLTCLALPKGAVFLYFFLESKAPPPQKPPGQFIFFSAHPHCKKRRARQVVTRDFFENGAANCVGNHKFRDTARRLFDFDPKRAICRVVVDIEHVLRR